MMSRKLQERKRQIKNTCFAFALVLCSLESFEHHFKEEENIEEMGKAVQASIANNFLHSDLRL